MPPLRVAFLGPAGTFSEDALRAATAGAEIAAQPYVDCASLFLTPPRNTRLLAVASARWGGWYGYCRFLRDGFSQGDVYVGPIGNTSGSSNFAMTRIIDVGMPASIKFQCKGAGDGFPASYADVQLSVVAIGSV